MAKADPARMSLQLGLFGGSAGARHPCCPKIPMCGHRVILGPRVKHRSGYNETVYCLGCQKIVGEISTRTDRSTP